MTLLYLVIPRGKNFHIKEWEKHIPSTNCFQFAVGNESIYGIERKLDLIDRQGGKVNYALFVIDHFVYERFAEDKKFPEASTGIRQEYVPVQVEYLQRVFR